MQDAVIDFFPTGDMGARCAAKIEDELAEFWTKAEILVEEYTPD